MSDEKRIAEIRERIAWMVWACEIEAYDEKSWDTWNDPGVRSFAEREHYYRCADKILALTRLEEAEKVMQLYRDGDWAGLIQWAIDHDCLGDAEKDPAEYVWEGDHEADARHTAPDRFYLLDVIARAWLEGKG